MAPGERGDEDVSVPCLLAEVWTCPHTLIMARQPLLSPGLA
jgi:hypothetical protein